MQKSTTTPRKLAGWLGFFLLLLLGTPAWAQYTNATQDGTIVPGTEYNNNEFVTRNGAGTGGSWFISWNGTTLYLAKNGGNSAEPSLVYFDTNPVQPVTDAASLLGGNGTGSLTGTTDYGVTPQLPFRADARIYTQGNYVEVRFRNGSGGWGAPNTTAISIATSGNVREIAVSWDALTGGNGRPARFNWLAYQTNTGSDTGNYRYDQAPGNPASFADNNTTPSYEYYFTVLSTDSGYYPTPAPANDRPTNVISFTGRRDVNYGTFNSTGVWDMTYDSPGRSLTRTSNDSNTDWAIGGTFTVSAGTLNFGTAAGSGATTAGNLLVTNTGVLNMNSTSKALNVTGATDVTANNVRLTNGGTLTLSSTIGGDLNLNGDFTLNNGSTATTTFTPNNRAVSFLGSVTQTITGPAAGTLTFNFMSISGSDASNSLVRLGSDINVTQTLTFNRGNLSTLNGSNAYVLKLGTTGQLSGETDLKNLTGFVTSTRTVGAGGSAPAGISFGNTGLTLTPTGSSAAMGVTTVTRSRGVGNLRAPNNNQSINRNFRVEPTNTAGPFEETMRFDYLDPEVAANMVEGNLQLFYSTNVPTYPTSGTGNFTQLNLTTISQSNNIATRAAVTDFSGASGTVFTLGDQTAPLPVKLVSFQGQRTSAGAARLAWRTALEVDNAGFALERQAGDGQWQDVAFVRGTGSSQGQAYDYLDAKAPATQLYYRLRQTDLSGTTTYSPVVAVAPVALLAAAPALHLSPVPAPADQASLNVDLRALPAAARILAVYDLQGRLLLQATAAADDTDAALPIGPLASGTYLVLVSSSGTSYHSRFNKL